MFFTPTVGSVASSSTMTFSFSPPIELGHRLMPFLLGMPSAEVGPVSGMLTPMVTSACACAASVAMATASQVFIRCFMDVSVCSWGGENR